MNIQQVSEFLYAHLDTIALIKEFEHYNLYKPLSKNIWKNLPEVNTSIVTPNYKDIFSIQELHKIGRENRKQGEKIRKRMIFLLDTYHINNERWNIFFKKENINYNYYLKFFNQTQELFGWFDKDFYIQNDNLKNIDWDKRLVWMGMLLRDYNKYFKR